MYLSAQDVYNVLSEKGVTHLYHANSVATACQFLRTGCLVSRGVIERRGLSQTPQSSDEIDKMQGIWYDVFVDSVDIHERSSRANIYGPVLFEISLEILREQNMPPVWVTKSNPTKWTLEQSNKEKWFESIDELAHNFVKGRFDQMIVFRHIGGELPFSSYIENIILDDPEYRDDTVDLYSAAGGALSASAKHGLLKEDIKIFKRSCVKDCKCKNYYKNPISLGKMFLP